MQLSVKYMKTFLRIGAHSPLIDNIGFVQFVY